MKLMGLKCKKKNQRAEFSSLEVKQFQQTAAHQILVEIINITDSAQTRVNIYSE